MSAPTDWPGSLAERMGSTAPPALQVIGPVALLAGRKTALFCSARTPGDAILRAHDTARRLRDEGATVISGFYAPLEQACLRLPAECRTAFDAGRLLLLSSFIASPRRVTRDAARRRNEVVAALADEVFMAHLAAGSRTARLADMLTRWGVPFVCPP
jgi:predicted Rossmann fold nucleotide-binding protein DprA/Smf involved in DNA uptake